jgi:hypothetical protein
VNITNGLVARDLPLVAKLPIRRVWRTLLVPESFNFAQMHELIQAAFGWTDSHLHQFILGGLVVVAPDPHALACSGVFRK